MNPFFKKATFSTILLALVCFTSANAAAAPSPQNDFTIDINTVLAGCAFLLFIVIFTLGTTLRAAILFYHQKRKKESENKRTGGIVPALIFLMLCAAVPAFAQDTLPVANNGTTIPEAEVVRWILLVVLGIEIVVIFLFARLIRFFTGVEAFQKTVHPSKRFGLKLAKFWNNINNFRPIEEEASLDTGHSYDGIRELNNVTPPWFIAGFILSILFSTVYMWRYHVSHSAPSQIEEYNISVAEAKVRIDEYLKNQANNVDENTVVVLGGDDIAAGQALFASNCVACHGDKGQGASVGPNLSDNYWLHKGGIKDIFKSIKYGWQEKGMKSWKDDFSPTQIAQLASFIHSLKGSNPPGAKEPQGELYEEEKTSVAPDTTVALR